MLCDAGDYDSAISRIYYAAFYIAELLLDACGLTYFAPTLAKVLTPFREGPCPIRVHFVGDGVKVNLSFGKEWRVRPTGELMHRLEELLGPQGVELDYQTRASAAPRNPPVH